MADIRAFFRPEFEQETQWIDDLDEANLGDLDDVQNLMLAAIIGERERGWFTLLTLRQASQPTALAPSSACRCRS